MENYYIKENTVSVSERGKNKLSDLLESSIPDKFTSDALITVPKQFTWMSDVFSELPTNCILNKGVTGCGGTTLAIRSKRKYVIAVPNISMIENKLKSESNLFGLYGGIPISKLDEFIRRGGNKIMVTYDSLYKVSKLLGDKTKDWHVLIDEEHTILMAGDYRNKAVNSVLQQYGLYKDYTFLSATPVHNEYRLDSTKHIKKIEIHWEASFEGKVNKISSTDPLKDIAFKCFETLTSSIDVEPNKYIFLNSLNDIKNVINNIQRIMKKRNINLSENISIYCANNKRNKSFFKVKMKDKFKVLVVNERNRRINFLTATAFEGSDIFDENGESIVVMTAKQHTIANIFMTLPQIFGRIRNTKFNKNVYVYYYIDKDNGDIFRSEKSFQEHLDMITDFSKGYVEKFNNYKERSLDLAHEYAKTIDYDTLLIDIKGDDNGNVTEMFVNESLAKAKMNSYKTLMTTFKVIDRIERANINRTVSYDYIPKESEFTNERIEGIKAKSGINFKATAKMYCSLRKEKELIESSNMDDTLSIPSNIKMSENGVLERYENINEALTDLQGLYFDMYKWYDSIGETGFIRANYSKTNILRMFTTNNKRLSQKEKVRRLLGLKDGRVYQPRQLKYQIQRAYDDLGINQRAKSEDINEFYNAEFVRRRVKGKPTKGWTIVNVT